MIRGRSITVIKLTSIFVGFTCITLVFIPTGGILGIFQGSLGLIVCLEGYFAALEVNLSRLALYMLGILFYTIYSIVIAVLALVAPCTLDEECCYRNIIDESTRQLLRESCENSYRQYGYMQLVAGVALPMFILIFFTFPAYKDLRNKVGKIDENLETFLYPS